MITGHTYAHAETGTEGFVWAVIQDGEFDHPYQAMHDLKAGDRLELLSDEDGATLWDFIIDPDGDANKAPRFEGDPDGQPLVYGALWVHWAQRGFDPDAWADFFIRREYRCRLTIQGPTCTHDGCSQRAMKPNPAFPQNPEGVCVFHR